MKLMVSVWFEDTVYPDAIGDLVESILEDVCRGRRLVPLLVEVQGQRPDFVAKVRIDAFDDLPERGDDPAVEVPF